VLALSVTDVPVLPPLTTAAADVTTGCNAIASAVAACALAIRDRDNADVLPVAEATPGVRPPAMFSAVPVPVASPAFAVTEAETDGW
jgi:hypothetical protein